MAVSSSFVSSSTGPARLSQNASEEPRDLDAMLLPALLVRRCNPLLPCCCVFVGTSSVFFFLLRRGTPLVVVQVAAGLLFDAVISAEPKRSARQRSGSDAPPSVPS